MSIAMAGIGVGGTIFSPIITTLLEYYGWRHTYQIMALIILVLAFPAAFFLLRKSPQDMGLLPYGSQEPRPVKDLCRAIFLFFLPQRKRILVKGLLLDFYFRYALQWTDQYWRAWSLPACD